MQAGHPPSGSTVLLIVSLGFLRTPRGLVVPMLGVVVLPTVAA